MTIKAREVATIVAALRIYQQSLAMNGGEPPQDVHDIATDSASCSPMESDEIDDLAEAIIRGALLGPDHDPRLTALEAIAAGDMSRESMIELASETSDASEEDEDLGDLRWRGAERELESYDFGNFVPEMSSGRWESDNSEDVWTTTLFLRSFDDRSQSIKGDFAVEFAPKCADVVSARAQVNGVHVGHRAEARDDSSPTP
jgi:hypothetical protein